MSFELDKTRYLSHAMSLEITHRVRARPDAIVVGVGTVLVDNPRLTARTETGRPQPKRGVLDRELRTPVDAALFDAPGGEICIVISDHACPDRADALERAGASV